MQVRDAVAHSALSVAQVQNLPSVGLSVDSAVAGVVSDNTAFSFMALYRITRLSLFVGYENIRYANPSTPLQAGFDDEGGYKLGAVNNTAFFNDKILQIFWTGIRYKIIHDLGFVLAYYGYHQNSYASGMEAGCSTEVSPSCSGVLRAVSFSTDLRLTKRFDAYLGSIYSNVRDGLASGYLHTSDLSITTGIRFAF